ncbi:MAG: TatD family hydrolase [Deltaproteobacteria bacterium]|jgi:TatD DNase family protein|nr:TatD family hydrolase [Deltaproteobacteria bacterium]
MPKTKKNIMLPKLPTGINVIDTHCHLDMISSTADLDKTVTQAAASGVTPIITVGIDLQSSQKAIQLAGQYDAVYATVGIHPHNVQSLDEGIYAELEKLCRAPKVVAYGEIGLDYVKQYAPKDVQLEHYERQLDLARNTGLPLVIHDREAHDDILHILMQKGPISAGGVMHCFSGNWQYAQKVLDLGFFISIPGVVTFNKAFDMQEVAQKVPLERLLLENDAPFLTPEPLRGKKNFPEYVLYTAQKIATLRGLSLEKLARITTENGLQLFNIRNH